MANGLASENIDNGTSTNLGKPIISSTPPNANAITNGGNVLNIDNESATLGSGGSSGDLASEEVSIASMTGLAVPQEPVTDSAKTIVEPTSMKEPNVLSDPQGHEATSGSAASPRAEPAEVTMDHAMSVDAPTSDLRGEPAPSKNPAHVAQRSADAAGDKSRSTKSRDDSDQPQSPISPPEERRTDVSEHDSATHPVVASNGLTPPQSSAAASPKPSQSEPMNVDEEGTDSPTNELVSSAPTSQAVASASSVKHDRSDDRTEPSAKRARTDDGSGASSPAVTFAEPDPLRKMTTNRQKYCLQVLRQLKKSKDAPPFLQPVNPIKLKIPDYPKIVTNPQDLGTIESKLKKGGYQTIDDFIDSVELVWSNCQRYNGPESPINLMALRLKELFERQIRTMPAPESTEPKAAPIGKGSSKKAGKGASAAPAAAARPRKTSSPAAVNIRRDSIGVDGRPKREIHAPPPKSLPYQNAPQRRGKNAVQLKFCAAVLKELTHKKHEAFAFPFYVPVDAKALGLHDYHTVIRNPMDLGTMQSKLAAGEYDSADDFEYDIRLMFRNCYKYNGPGQPVNIMGHRLENVFNEKWAEKPIPRPGGYGSESEDESGPDEQGKQTVQMLTKQLEAMKNQIASINSQKKKKKPKRERYDDDDGGMGPRDSDGYKSGKAGGRKGREAVDDLDESPMFPTFEQKTALSTKMGYMTEHQMPVVIQILKRTDPNFDPEDEEVELDVDKVHPKTIRLLWNWIMDDIQPSFMRKKAPKPKKNRNVLSENEQQRQIEQLEAQLNKFNGGEGADAYGYNSRYGNIPNDDSSDSDSDASSEEDD